MSETIDNVMKDISELLSNYEFPFNVLVDIDKRLSDNREVNYAKQQLRYLTNLIKAGVAKKK